MDPLSVIAGIAGISQAGASLSRAIFNMISAARSAPKEISDIAKGISDLSIILGELRRVLRDGKDLCRRKLLRRVGSAIKRIGRIHGEIEEVLDVKEGAYRLKWAFRRSKCTQLLYQIESHKTAINTILHTMSLALQLKLLSKMRDEMSQSSDGNNDTLEDADLTRQQTENLIDVSFLSLKSLIAQGGQNVPPSMSGDDHEQVEDQEVSESSQVQLWKASANDTAIWLYDLVFSSASEALHTSNYDSETNHFSEAIHLEDSEDQMGQKSRQSDLPDALIPWRMNHPQSLALLVRRPVPSASVVNELLSEWTTLTEDEIEGGKYPQAQKFEGKNNIEPHLQFKDAVGRKFAFPWHVARTWAGIEGLIKESFLHVDVVGPHVAEGHYDLLGPDGAIILPSVWEKLVEPGWAITMQMWPETRPEKDRTGPSSPAPWLRHSPVQRPPGYIGVIRSPGANSAQGPNLAGLRPRSVGVTPPLQKMPEKVGESNGTPVKQPSEQRPTASRESLGKSSNDEDGGQKNSKSGQPRRAGRRKE